MPVGLPDSQVVSLTPWTENINAAGFNLTGVVQVAFNTSNIHIQENGPGMQYNVNAGGGHDLRVDTTNEYRFNSTEADFLGNNIRNVGYFESNATNPATSGVFRVGHAEIAISSRNNANTGNSDFGFGVQDIDNWEFFFAGVQEYAFSSTEADFLGNNIRNVGYFESNDANPAQSGAIRLGYTEQIVFRNSVNSADVATLGLSATNNATFATNLDMEANNIVNVGVFESNATNPPDEGTIRLGNNERLTWRNSANTDNFRFYVNASNIFQIPTNINLSGNYIDNVASLTSNAGIPATTGAIRLGNGDSIEWRDSGNTANLGITLNASNDFIFDADIDMVSGGSVRNLNQLQWTDAGTVRIAINASDLQYTVPTGNLHEFQVNEVNEYVFSSTEADFLGNNLIGVATVKGTNNLVLDTNGANAIVFAINGFNKWQINTAGDMEGGGNDLLEVASIRSTGTEATAGFIRMANNTAVRWRNNGNTADIGIWANSSNRLMTDMVGLDLDTADIIGVDYIQSNAANPAAAGKIRLGNLETIAWRNAGNTGDRTITIDGSDNFALNAPIDMNGNPIYEVGSMLLNNSQYVQFGSTNPATAGAVRLRNNGLIVWRNSANTQNFSFGVNSTDDFEMDINGVAEYTFDSSQITINDSKDIAVGTTDGTKIGTATTQKLGFWNATPVVQPNGTGETVGFTAGAGTGVNDDSTFTGNVGATAYRISDVVKALKNIGVLAQ